jgi:hypothetical protein
MNIPDEVMRLFVKEAENTKYGKVSLGIIRRGRHEHFEIDKHITITQNGEVVDSDQREKTIEV